MKTRKFHKKKKNTRYKKRGGANLAALEIADSIPIAFRKRRFATIIEYPGNIYGSSLPMFHLDRFAAGDRIGQIGYSFQFFLHCILNKKIYNFYSFQACGIGYDNLPFNHRNHCFPLEYPGAPRPLEIHDWEEQTFMQARDLAINITQDLQLNIPPMQFTNILIADLTPGFLGAWLRLILIPNPEIIGNSVLFHCLAGYGRTGAAMLFMRLRTFDLANFVNPLWGAPDSTTLFTYLRDTVIRNDLTISTSTYPAQTAVLNRTPDLINRIINEIMLIDTLAEARIFISRMNYILLSILLFHQYNGPMHYFVMPVAVPAGGFNQANIFVAGPVIQFLAQPVDMAFVAATLNVNQFV